MRVIIFCFFNHLERRMNENENKNNFWKAITAWNPWPTNSNSGANNHRKKILFKFYIVSHKVFSIFLQNY